MADTHLTTGDIAAELGVPIWRVRRAVDALCLACPRAGLYRLIPRELIPQIREELGRRPAPPKEVLPHA
jgi:hypothetical protein